MDIAQARRTAAQQLQSLPLAKIDQVPAVIGFDGFVDHIIDVVDCRSGPHQYQALATIADFGGRVSAAAGRSTNFELVVKQSKIGGNGPIMANALATLGHSLTYIGNVGDEQLHPAFAPLADKAAAMISLGDPAVTDALEFRDGKLMLGKLDPLDRVSVSSLRHRVGDERLLEIVTQARCVATVNWTMLLAMNAIWEHLLTEVLPQVSGPRSWWFVDLADPAKRSEEDLRQALHTLQRLQQYTDVVLGLNEAEARQVLKVLNADWQGDSEDLSAAELACETIRQRLQISRVVCHMVRGAAAASESESAGVAGFYEPNPMITTGAGDHFNAGYLWSLVAGCEETTALLVGTATSGHYVRRAQSPTRDDLVRLLLAE